MYKNLYINIIAAALSLIGTYIFGNMLLPVLRRLRLVKSGEEKLIPEEKNIIQSAGTALCIGTVLASSIGLMLLRFFSSSIDFDNRTDPMFFLSEILIIISAAAGFYSDILKANGKSGGASGKAALFTRVFICMTMLTAKYYLDNNTKIYIPFKGYSDIKGMYYPVMLIIMTAVWSAVSASASRTGDIPAVLTAVFLGGMALFSHVRSDETALLCASLAGASMGLLMLNLPRLILSEGDSGRYFFGASVSLLFAVSEYTVFIGIMLLPVFARGIIHFLKSRQIIKQREKTVTPAARTEGILRLFLSGMISVTAALIIFFMTYKK